MLENLLLLMVTSPFVLAGKDTRCMSIAGGITAGLGAGCTLLTVGAGAMACSMGSAAMGSIAWSGCFGEINKRDIVIDPTAIKQTKHAFCADFGKDYGFECIKPRHVKKLGDFMIKNSCKTNDTKAQACLGSKFYASCDGSEWQPDMCKIGHECEQNGNQVSCVPI